MPNHKYQKEETRLELNDFLLLNSANECGEIAGERKKGFLHQEKGGQDSQEWANEGSEGDKITL